MWKRQKRARVTSVERAKAKLPSPPPQDHGPVREVLSDGTIIEYSAAMGRSVIVPAAPVRQGLDVRPVAPAWQGWASLRRRLLGW
jgi:hypothetical protein